MTTNTIDADRLALPVVSFIPPYLQGKDLEYAKSLDGYLQRQFRAIESYLNAPHVTFGSAMVSPMFVDEDNTSYSGVSIPDTGSGSYREYTFPHTPITCERPFKIFVWAVSEIENSSGSSAGVDMHVRCTTSWGIDNYTSRGRNYFTNDGKGRQIVTLKSFAGLPSGTKQLTLKWAYQNNSGGSLNMDIRRQRAMYAMYYAPDAAFDPSDGGSPVNGRSVRWTRSSSVISAYRYSSV